MSSRRQREEWTELARRLATDLCGRLATDLCGWLATDLCGWLARRLTAAVRLLPPSRGLYPVGLTVFLFGWGSAAAWPLTGLVSAWTTGFALAAIEFPLGDPRGAAVDARGRIYVADALHLRVQRYSPAGTFECGWFVPRKVFGVRTTADGRVVVGAEGGALLYTADGELIELLPDSGRDRRWHFAAEAATAPYRVRRGLLPHVVEARTGQTVVAGSWPVRLTASPFPAFLYGLVGLTIVALADARRRHESPAPGPGNT